MASEIPVARMVGTGLVKTLDTLIYEFDGRLHTFRAQHLDNLTVDIVDTELGIDAPHMITAGRIGLASLIHVGNHLFPTLLLDESDGGTEGTELFQARHVDAIVVGVAYLGRTRHHHNLLGMQTVEDLEDALAQRHR